MPRTTAPSLPSRLVDSPFVVVLALFLVAAIGFAPGCSDDDDKDPDPTPVGAFHPTEDAEIEGTMEVTSVLIPAGVTITVRGDLDLRSSGPVEIAGQIVGECVEIAIESDETMSITGEIRNACVTDTTLRSIRLVCDGELTLVDGEIRSAGDIEISNDPTLTDGDFPDSTGLRAGADTVAETEAAPAGGGPIVRIRNFSFPTPPRAPSGVAGRFGRRGQDGSTFTLSCRGDLHVEGGVTVQGQDGGAGGAGQDGNATAANARGGAGGAGGLLRVRATGEIVFSGSNLLFGGNGGPGGSANAVGSGPSASATARAGKGGDSGLIEVLAGGPIEIDGPLQLVVGRAGDGGNANGMAGDGVNGQPGGAADARGGEGGQSPNKKLLSANVSGVGNVTVSGGDGGHGGRAAATAGNGGDGAANRRDGGPGGAIHGRGGDGGDALIRNQNGAQVGAGGNGGEADLAGGNGGHGWDGCNPPILLAGGAGGDGGDASGGDGDFGQGLTPGESLGGSIQVAGNAGNGGNGNPGGFGGEGGANTVVFRGPSSLDAFSFLDGFDGGDCAEPFGACCTGQGACVLLSSVNCFNADGVYQGDFTVCDPNPCPRFGACCFDDGSCTFGIEDDCHGGTYLGHGSSCDPNPCDPPTGACCFPTAACALVSETVCFENDGEYQGDGTTCNPDPCAGPPGACCDVLGQTCRIRTEGACLADSTSIFEFLGPGTDCDPIPCDLSTGACCFETTACVVASPSQCLEAGGVYQGVDTTCEPENPCAPHIGACCFDDGICVIGDEEDCHGGVYIGDDTTCEPDPCLELGACCVEGVCFFTNEGTCFIESGDYLGNGSVCLPNPCPAPSGACCFDDGSCVVGDEEDCHGGFYNGDGTTCEPDPCLQQGACCIDGVCYFGDAETCSIGGGDYLGNGSDCEPDPCEGGEGACCVDVRTCIVTTESGCVGEIGSYLGDGTTCEPENPCADYGGACCLPGECVIAFEPDCILFSGDYQGHGTNCEPDPCPTPPGACCFGDGTCQQLPVEDCHGGEFLGQGTVCEPNPCEPSPNTGACCTWLDGCVMTSPEACFGEFGGIGSPCVDCPDILIEGIWDCEFEVLEDQNPPHDQFVGGRNIHSFTFSGTGNALGATGAAPFVHSKGTISQNGAFVLVGSGTVAGFPNVDVRFSGMIDARAKEGGWVLQGEYRFGNTTAPFQLPNGPITYSVQATRVNRVTSR